MAPCGGCDVYGPHDHPHARYALTTNTKEPDMGWIADLMNPTTEPRRRPVGRVEPMQVRRVRDGLSSSPEPALDQSWSEFDRLRWHAAIISTDTSSKVEVQLQPLTCWDDKYEVHVPVFGPQRAIDYDAAFRMLKVYERGYAAGIEAARDEAANSLMAASGTFGAAPPAAPSGEDGQTP